jgi:HK97 family phage major capsid protein
MRRAVSEDFWANAKYFMHPYVLAYIEQIKDSSGNFIVRQPADSSQNRTIWGHEIVTVSGMPSADAAATAYIGFGDPSFCYLGTRGSMAMKMLDQASLTTAGNLAEKNLTALRVIERFGQVWTCEAGVSIWKTKA